ncbi:MAG: TfoX/Sxy family DNA transformation protein [Bdellovibrionaceae bacterium]|nr:TfoX/Sxy family DNA transformation protein [Bdellovibrionales bacterium]MCB9085169.1 TfoX/Sxy family DNA transformation protein [Pseudobdellovibrionaceae bacterium]
MKGKSLTPIADARNLGPVTADELASIGILSLEEMIDMGWEEVCIRYVEAYPERLNLNAFTAIIGAIENQDWRKVDSATKIEAKLLIKKIKSGNY